MKYCAPILVIIFVRYVGIWNSGVSMKIYDSVVRVGTRGTLYEHITTRGKQFYIFTIRSRYNIKRTQSTLFCGFNCFSTRREKYVSGTYDLQNENRRCVCVVIIVLIESKIVKRWRKKKKKRKSVLNTTTGSYIFYTYDNKNIARFLFVVCTATSAVFIFNKEKVRKTLV